MRTKNVNPLVIGKIKNLCSISSGSELSWSIWVVINNKESSIFKKILEEWTLKLPLQVWQTVRNDYWVTKWKLYKPQEYVNNKLQVWG